MHRRFITELPLGKNVRYGVPELEKKKNNIALLNPIFVAFYCNSHELKYDFVQIPLTEITHNCFLGDVKISGDVCQQKISKAPKATWGKWTVIETGYCAPNK